MNLEFTSFFYSRFQYTSAALSQLSYCILVEVVTLNKNDIKFAIDIIIFISYSGLNLVLFNIFAGEINFETGIRSTQLNLSKNWSVYLYLGIFHSFTLIFSNFVLSNHSLKTHSQV